MIPQVDRIAAASDCFKPYGPPGEGAKYRPFYQAVVKDKITWERPIFESVVMTMQNATDKPFKVAFLGPAQQSVIVKDEFYGDQVAVAGTVLRHRLRPALHMDVDRLDRQVEHGGQVLERPGQ